MCIRAYLNGDGSGYKTHLSLFFVLMKGEYDALLRWPFDYKVSMILVGKDCITYAPCCVSHCGSCCILCGSSIGLANLEYFHIDTAVTLPSFSPSLPPSLSLSLSLPPYLDQNHRKHIVQTFKPTPESSSFQRPQSDMNVASGCPQFTKLSTLDDDNYVKDDVMYIKCIVDTSRIFHP